MKHQYTQEAITSEADIHALDRALAVISVDPEICAPIPGDATAPQLRQLMVCMRLSAENRHLDVSGVARVTC
ncbi:MULTISPECIES: hypothetical protein [unclassified Streptomyces]|uniref:hypothetical protein n=1 Tax=unclassified Streptomyces TaxID=2593676 RepID=UPI00332AB62D